MESCICQVRVILYYSFVCAAKLPFELTPFSRLGQEPPPPQQEDSYDGRSLAEVSRVTPVSMFVVFTSRYWSQCCLETRGK